MVEYIERDALLENLKRQYGEDLGWQCTVNMSDIGMMIEGAPTADVVEVRRGYWIFRNDSGYCRTRSYCSACGKHSGIGGIRKNQNKPYCPNCGAKMDGERTG